MKIALAQINNKIGDLEGNFERIVSFIEKAKVLGADLVIFPELSVTGYPPRDLLDFDYFVEDNLKVIEKLKAHTDSIGVAIGYIDKSEKQFGKKYYNTAAFIYRGEIVHKHYKCLLPFYDVFDETRYFEPGKEVSTFEFKGKKLALTICEDIWNDKSYWDRPLYEFNPIEELQKKELDILLNLSASPYWVGKEKDRKLIISNIASLLKVPVIYVNQTGGNDDLLFDGLSFAMDANSKIQALCNDFNEDLLIYDSEKNSGIVKKVSDSEEKSLFKALRTGLKDYCHKLGFNKVVLGLSGGIDSAVTAVIACYALGNDNVLGITMPSMYSSEGSVTDSEKIAKNLKMKCKTIPIKDMFDSYIKGVQGDEPLKMDVAEENLQARVRGNILMMHSNRYGYLLLSTGNKSEMAMGYCTLYGDMSGGLSILSDVPKTMVYKLAEFINAYGEIIPYDIIEKPPSAELRPDQKDQDSLPPYEVLDDILKDYLEEHKPVCEITKKYPSEIVEMVVKKVNMNEYKRRQASIGLKVTTKAFGSGRRMPIVHGYDFGIRCKKDGK
ncbi:MAG: NAD+ synthase [bacterium]